MLLLLCVYVVIELLFVTRSDASLWGMRFREAMKRVLRRNLSFLKSPAKKYCNVALNDNMV